MSLKLPNTSRVIITNTEHQGDWGLSACVSGKEGDTCLVSGKQS